DPLSDACARYLQAFAERGDRRAAGGQTLASCGISFGAVRVSGMERGNVAFGHNQPDHTGPACLRCRAGDCRVCDTVTLDAADVRSSARRGLPSGSAVFAAIAYDRSL